MTEERILAIYEAAERNNESVKQGTEILEKALSDFNQILRAQATEIRSLKDKSDALVQSIETKFNVVLAPQIEETRRIQANMVENKKAEIRQYWLITAGICTILFMITIGGIYYHFDGAIKADKTYWDNEKKSLFGARLEENENGQFIVFDNDYIVQYCESKNCIAIKRL